MKTFLQPTALRLAVVTALVLAAGLGSVRAQYATVFYPAGSNASTVNVPTGSTLTVNTLNLTGGAGVGLAYGTNKTLSYPISKGDVIAGPATISFSTTLYSSSPGFLLCTYHLADATGTGVSLPSNAVVVPANATGDVQVILEQSTDLVTWTAATPGTYNSSTTKRFFRVRATQQ